MGKVEIYSLSCPITNEVRYIGKANDSKKRLKSHLRDSKTRNTPVYIWIKELTSKGLIPKIDVLKTIDNSDWKKAEIDLISEYKNGGGKLLNVALGGDEPFCPNSVRQANGRKTANLIHSNPDKKRIWRIKHQLGLSLFWLEKNVRGERAAEIRTRLLNKGIYV